MKITVKGTTRNIDRFHATYNASLALASVTDVTSRNMNSIIIANPHKDDHALHAIQSLAERAGCTVTPKVQR